MSKPHGRSIAAKPFKRPAPSLIERAHAHPALASIALILIVGILPAVVEWLAS